MTHQFIKIDKRANELKIQMYLLIFQQFLSGTSGYQIQNGLYFFYFLILLCYSSLRTERMKKRRMEHQENPVVSYTATFCSFNGEPSLSRG